MSSAEQFRVLLFLALVATVYVLSAKILLRDLWRKLDRARPAGRRSRWTDRVVLTMAGIGLLCFAYGRFVEPYRLTVSHVRIITPKIPMGFGTLRIVHISDIHSDPVSRLESKLPEAIRAERPDVIVFTGDSLNSPEGLPVFTKCLGELSKIAPTFAVKGNWDSWYWNSLRLFAGTGAIELDGTSAPIHVRGLEVWLAGVAVENEGGIDRALDSIPPGALKVFLYHYPDFLNELADRNVDLYLAGHTHGGQIALPFYGALITLAKFGKRYEAGLYRERDTWLYVNRGIGMEGGHAPRVRFWAPPELTVIEMTAVQP